MSKGVMLSVRPKWCEKIASGEKTIEVRKTKPKLETPFKCYIYCSKAKKRLIDILKDGDENYGEIYHGKPVFIKVDEGSVCDMWGKRQKVIGEFTCDRIYKIDKDSTDFLFKAGGLSVYKQAAEEKCGLRVAMADDELRGYLGHCQGYGWHISDLKIYGAPKDLNEFWLPPELYCEKERCGGCPYDQVPDVNGEYSFDCEWKRPLMRPPQSWCYVEVMKDV